MNSSINAQSSSDIKRVAIIFSGGPAPAANAVISTAAASFLRNGVSVFGFMHGYSHLIKYGPQNPMKEGRDYIPITHQVLKRTRNSQGIIIGTARVNPGKRISSPKHLEDKVRTAPLQTVYDALVSLDVDALISVGGDDELKTANAFKLYQETLSERSKKIAVVHLPKTIDNDYQGIDFTFGYFTAVETLAGEIRNLLADAEANRSYYIVEMMGRRAGWLAYGAAIAGEASLVLSVEDIREDYQEQEYVVNSLTGEEVIDSHTGEPMTRKTLQQKKVVDIIVETMRAREVHHMTYGVIVIAEGLAELLPNEFLKNAEKDDCGNIALGKLNLASILSDWISGEYMRKMGKSKKVLGLQLGYECRCARPFAFDVILGSQLGVGAYRALAEKRLNGVMVSVKGQLDIEYVDFDKLIDPKTLIPLVRPLEIGSDFHRLARFLELRDLEDNTC